MKAKIIFVPIVIVFTSFFLFPFYFTFLPDINTKMILAALGLAILLVRLGINGHGFISKDFFWISVCALGVSFASFLSMTLNETSDGAYLSYIVTMWVWVGAAYCVVQMIKAVHGKVNAELICFYMISVGVFQCLLAIAIDSVPAIKNLVDSFLAGEGFMGKADGRLYGIGCAYDVAGGRFAVLLVMIAALLPKMYKKENPNMAIAMLLVAFGIISVIGNMIGRTASVGMVIGILYMLFVMFSKQVLDKNDRSKYVFGILSFLCITILASTVLYNTSNYWYDYFRFGFEGFFSLVEKGEWDVQSNNMLMEGLVFPDNLRCWIIGDGWMGSMAEDPYYIGETWYGFYMGTDAGYSRFLFYFGLIGMTAFVIFLAKVSSVCAKYSPNFKLMFWAIFLLNLIIWCKVSTDIFLVFAPFLCLGGQISRQESVEGRFVESVYNVNG